MGQLINIYSVLPSGPASDADADAFLVAAGLDGDSTISPAITNFVVALKAAGIWTKIKALYPFVGGTASTHKWNLKDPRDLDAAFRLTYTGTITHDSLGFKGDGSSGWADTHLCLYSDISTANPIDSFHSSIYSQTDGLTPTSSIDIGCNNNSGPFAVSTGRTTGDLTFAYTGESYVSVTGSGIRNDGFFVSSRTSTGDSSGLALYREGVDLSASPTASYGGSYLPSVVTVAIGAYFSVFSAVAFSPRQMSLISFGVGLSSGEVTDFTTATTALQTALGRDV